MRPGGLYGAVVGALSVFMIDELLIIGGRSPKLCSAPMLSFSSWRRYSMSTLSAIWPFEALVVICGSNADGSNVTPACQLTESTSDSLASSPYIASNSGDQAQYRNQNHRNRLQQRYPSLVARFAPIFCIQRSLFHSSWLVAASRAESDLVVKKFCEIWRDEM